MLAAPVHFMPIINSNPFTMDPAHFLIPNAQMTCFLCIVQNNSCWHVEIVAVEGFVQMVNLHFTITWVSPE
jgi:hypothetical protein